MKKTTITIILLMISLIVVVGCTTPPVAQDNPTDTQTGGIPSISGQAVIDDGNTTNQNTAQGTYIDIQTSDDDFDAIDEALEYI